MKGVGAAERHREAEIWEDESDSTTLDQTGVRRDVEGRPITTGQKHQQVWVLHMSRNLA